MLSYFVRLIIFSWNVIQLVCLSIVHFGAERGNLMTTNQIAMEIDLDSHWDDKLFSHQTFELVK